MFICLRLSITVYCIVDPAVYVVAFRAHYCSNNNGQIYKSRMCFTSVPQHIKNYLIVGNDNATLKLNLINPFSLTPQKRIIILIHACFVDITFIFK